MGNSSSISLMMWSGFMENPPRKFFPQFCVGIRLCEFIRTKHTVMFSEDLVGVISEDTQKVVIGGKYSAIQVEFYECLNLIQGLVYRQKVAGLYGRFFRFCHRLVSVYGISV